MIHSLRTMMAATLLVAGATVAIAGSAEAVPPPPGDCTRDIGHYEQAGSFITGYYYRVCPDRDPVPFRVTVERKVSEGVYQIVSEGYGETTYYCNGTAYNVYRTTGTADFAISCG